MQWEKDTATPREVLLEKVKVRAIKEDLIGSVGLDVTTPEPLPPTHELYSFPSRLILSHVGNATMETRENMATMTLKIS
ncbi:hypothetical protein A0J61_04581 [Choanephora cucurbitarum]|uniref:D-isomer specific 2-hydroxyacid dehydrogenase NAD-binding domain-containing protein n=1 Tax=Choanephora cucurbitarum TaxID=101091 RepID=A0A1C7NF42_9FUNG|nr:hypothetical protein A0J61_04581 [Choanephora cucurbitarum]